MREAPSDQPVADVRREGPALAAVVLTIALFGGAAVLLWVATNVLIPAMLAAGDVEPIICWFIASALLVFVLLIVIAAMTLYREQWLGQPGVWRARLRFRAMTGGDWLWSIAALAAIFVLAAASALALRLVSPDTRLNPSFLSLDPLGPGRYWILAAWVPFFVLNILSEEILWRGVLLPRQEAAFGRWAWLTNGAGWLLFHLPLGPAILLLVAPTTFILPYVVQRRQNSWTGVVIHAGLNAPGFLAVAFGLA
jgi:membrane protease YdiL (CAAX protease family)